MVFLPWILVKNGMVCRLSWIEVVSGLKAEVFNNVYIGFSVRLNYLLSNKEPEGFANLHIPGFNKDI